MDLVDLIIRFPIMKNYESYFRCEDGKYGRSSTAFRNGQPRQNSGADPGIFQRRGRKVGCPVCCRWWSLPGHAPPENVNFGNTISSILREFDAILLLF